MGEGVETGVIYLCNEECNDFSLHLHCIYCYRVCYCENEGNYAQDIEGFFFLSRKQKVIEKLLSYSNCMLVSVDRMVVIVYSLYF